MKRLLLFSSIFILAIVAACSDGDQDTETEEESEERVVTVETAEVEARDFILERKIYGRTSPNRITPVMLSAPGEVTEISAANGDVVEEGDDIATVNTMQGHLTITAPADGLITNFSATDGSMVSNEDPLALIADTETLILEFTVTANVQNIFEIDETYVATIEGNEVEAMITEIDAMPGENGLYPVKATIGNPDLKFLPGMVGEMTVPEKTIENALTVPTAAIVREDDETFVYVIANHKAEKRTVDVLEIGSTTSAIAGDVEAGEEVVVRGQLTLSDGAQVDVQKGDPS